MAPRRDNRRFAADGRSGSMGGTSSSSSAFAGASSFDASFPASGDSRRDVGGGMATGGGARHPPRTLLERVLAERDALRWILGCALLGFLMGFGVGSGTLTRGHGTFVPVAREKRVPSSMAAKVNATGPIGGSKDRSARGRSRNKEGRKVQFAVSAWRVDLARRVRSTRSHRLLSPAWRYWGFGSAPGSAANAVLDLPPDEEAGGRRKKRGWRRIASPLWPANWILFRGADLSQIDVGDGGIGPWTANALAFLLPWRRDLVRALERKGPRSGAAPSGGGGGGGGESPGESPAVKRSSGSSMWGTGSGSSAPSAAAAASQPVNPYYHPAAFHALREHVVRCDGGYVHPDLGFLVPAPSGAERGIGMVRDSYTKCQVHCHAGTAEEKLKERRDAQALLEESKKQELLDQELLEEMMKEFPEMEVASSVESSPPSSSGDSTHIPPKQQRGDSAGANSNPMRNTTTYEGIQAAVQLQSTEIARPYRQTEVLLRIPLEAQITRETAVEALLTLLPIEADHSGTGRSTSNLDELDDAFVLALYLAHERGLGAASQIWPYGEWVECFDLHLSWRNGVTHGFTVATLPLRPTCALHWGWRQSVVDVVTAMSVEMGTDVQGWPNEIGKAAEMSERISSALARAWGDRLATRPGADDVSENVRWALCQVASRAVAGRDAHGSLRLVPVMDMINHDEAAGLFVELTGKERIEDGDFLDAREDDAGAFVVRSERYGERKPLRKGQELMANYNVPSYSPLDWFLNMGYIPPERAGKWTMLEAGLPRSYRGGFSRKSNSGSSSNTGAFGSGKPEIQVIRQHTQQQSCSRCV